MATRAQSPTKGAFRWLYFYKKTVFSDIGGFDETITSGEDTKLSQTLRENNYDVKILADLNIIHLGNPVTLKHFFQTDMAF